MDYIGGNSTEFTWVENIDVDANVDVLFSDVIDDLFQDRIGPSFIHLPGSDVRKPTTGIMVQVIVFIEQHRSRADVHTLIGQETLLVCDVEHCTMCDFCVFSLVTTNLSWVPGVEVRVEVEDCNRSRYRINRAKRWKGWVDGQSLAWIEVMSKALTDCVISSDSDQPNTVALRSVLGDSLEYL
jgi:hypothetical protein